MKCIFVPHFVALPIVATVVVRTGASAVNAARHPVPAMRNTCAETACAAIRSSAELVCSEQTWNADACEIALTDLRKCFGSCSGGQ